MRPRVHSKFLIAVLLVLACFRTDPGSAAEPGNEAWSTEFSHAGVMGTVYAIQPEAGSLVVGGRFDAITDVQVTNVARLVLDEGVVVGIEPLGNGLDGTVGALCEHEGELIASGYFFNSTAPYMNHFARWDGQQWHDLDADLPPLLRRPLVSYGGALYAGSYRWQGGEWVNVMQTDAGVTALVEYDGLLYVGGEFTQVLGQDMPHVFAWDGTAVVPLAGGVPAEVTSITAGPNGIVCGTSTGTGSGQALRWTGTDWVVERDGDGDVEALAYRGVELVVATTSYTFAGPYYYEIHRELSVHQGGLWNPLGNFEVRQLTAHAGEVLITPVPTVAGGIVAAGLLGLDAAGLRPVFAANQDYDQGFDSFARLGPALVAAGRFTVAGGQTIAGCGIRSGENWFPWDRINYVGPGVAQGVGQIEAVGSSFYGLLSVFDIDVSFDVLVKLQWTADGWTWTPLPSTIWDYNGWGRLQAVGTDLYSVGDQSGVSRVEPVTGLRIAAGDLDLDSWIAASCAHQSTLVIGGGFTTNAGVPVSNVLRLVDGSWESVGDALPGRVVALTALDGPRLAASFVQDGIWRVAVFDGAVWSVLPGDFAKTVSHLVWHRDHLFVAGSFENVGPVPASGIAAWTGERWAPLGSGLETTGYMRVADLISIEDRLWVAGGFTSAGGHPCVGLASWDGDPALLAGEATSVDDATVPDLVHLLESAAPNPFNPTTTLSFRLPAAGHLRLVVYDLIGRRVRVLAEGEYTAGRHQVDWHGDDDEGRMLASGTYVAHLKTPGHGDTVKLTLIK